MQPLNVLEMDAIEFKWKQNENLIKFETRWNIVSKMTLSPETPPTNRYFRTPCVYM